MSALRFTGGLRGNSCFCFAAKSNETQKSTPILRWTPLAPIVYGTPLGATQLNAAANVPGTYTYSPAQGIVLNAGAQALSVSFTPADTTNYVAASGSVTVTVTPADPVLRWTPPAPIVYGTALSATQLSAHALVLGSYTFSPAQGKVLSAGAQTLSVMFMPANTMDYASAADSVTLLVRQAAPVLSWNPPAAISYGTALSATQLDAHATVPGNFSYSPALGTILNAGSQTLSVTFTPSNATDYATAAASVQLTVQPAVPRITWAPAGLIAVGMALSSTQLDATATAPGAAAQLAGNYQYSPSAGSILNSSGSQTLTVAFTPADEEDYTTTEANAALTVLPFGIAAWGDSFTQGGQGDRDTGIYPSLHISQAACRFG
ncbi:MAG: hypothetical protein ABR991_11715 [Terracidiphilus sp.]